MDKKLQSYIPKFDLDERIDNLELSEEERWCDASKLKMEWEEYKTEKGREIQAIDQELKKTTYRSRVTYNLAKETVSIEHRNESRVEINARDLNEVFDRIRSLKYQVQGLRQQIRNLHYQNWNDRKNQQRSNRPY
ncbi:hypothetical protein QAD02_004207 [Eretmocerus hayati]|uniref:Uncharacterized protein n=1 Tax=Eretmocerus hayati TaxID=131215 RepID=A0ACC2NPX7_9HYME|nr:hypothetical protein QAD02_004207 [Eretmocerus hayati]